MADPFDTDALVPAGVRALRRPGITYITAPTAAPQPARGTPRGNGGGGDGGGDGGGGSRPPSASKSAQKHPIQPKPTQAAPLNIPGSYRPRHVAPLRRADPTAALGHVVHHGGGITLAATGASMTPKLKTYASPNQALTAQASEGRRPTKPARAQELRGHQRGRSLDLIGLEPFLDPQAFPSYRPGYGPTGRLSPAALALSQASLPAGRRGGGGFWSTLDKDVLRPVEQAAPLVLPYAAAAAVLTICPECVAAAGLAAGVTSFAAHKEIAHESTDKALLAGAIDVAGTVGGEVAKRALVQQVDALLLRGETAKARDLLLLTILQASQSERAAASGHP